MHTWCRMGFQTQLRDLSIADSLLGKDEAEVAILATDGLGSAGRLYPQLVLGMLGHDKLKPSCCHISNSLSRKKTDSPHLLDIFVCFSIHL